MSVFKRKTTNGETAEYHYRFMKAGKTYAGVCVGCLDRDDAIQYEKAIRDKVDTLRTQKNVKALVENFRDELSCGEQIALKDAFFAASKKPRRRKMSQRQYEEKSSRFSDFVLFVTEMHPEIEPLVNNVTPAIAEQYIAYIRANGRYSKEVSSPRGSYSTRYTKLSTATLNRFLEELRSVFDALQKQTGMLENPFADIPAVFEETETREAFTEKELELILAKAPPFIRAIFVVGFFTALREGDISTLRWSDVLWEHGVIRRKLLKTGATVEIPIMPPLATFLKEQLGNDPEYVLPEHSTMYQNNPSGITYRVKKFLEDDCNISTTKKVEGRTRAVSIKDVHSLRHTFCYFAGVAGIPLVVVQSIVGHMTKDMTAHYTAHADRKTKREKLTALPIFKALTENTARKELEEQTRLRLIEAIKKADSETLNRVASLLLPVKLNRSLLHSTEQGKSN